MTTEEFRKLVLQGIPSQLPDPKPYNPDLNHAPRRKDVLSKDEKRLALRNALRYFEPSHHSVLASEFVKELEEFGRIYMYRFSTDYEIYSRNINY